MATTLFDLQVTVSSQAPIRGLSDSERQDLFRKPAVATKRPKEAGAVTTTTADQIRLEQVEEEALPTMTEISDSYADLIARANDLLRRISERSKGLVLRFNPEDEPALAEAVASIFQDTNNKITFEMYLAALRLDSDIAVELGEQEIGTIRESN